MHLAAMAGMTLTLLLGCQATFTQKPAPSPPILPKTTTQTEGAMAMQNKLGDLDSLKALIGQNQKAFEERFAILPQHISSDAVFERTTKLVQIHNPALGQIWFYFQDGKLSVIDWSDATALKALDGKALVERFGKGGTWLRSRAGKSHNLRVWAAQGVAISLAGSEVDYLHFFPAMSEQEYEQALYQDPGPFIR